MTRDSVKYVLIGLSFFAMVLVGSAIVMQLLFWLIDGPQLRGAIGLGLIIIAILIPISHDIGKSFCDRRR